MIDPRTPPMEEILYHNSPRHFNAGFVVLSFVVSYIGALSTLELLQRRTSGRGWWNWYLLIASSITMGGVAIWSMHFVANLATVMFEGEDHLQLEYSPTYTALSFFVPIFVLLPAFYVAGGAVDHDGKAGLMRVVSGGVLSGSSIAGMHHLGGAGIANYKATSSVGYVIGSVIVGCTAATAAITIFFVLRKKFTNAWWKRMLLASLLTGAVEGMHWTATLGTSYVYRGEDEETVTPLGRQGVVIIVTTFSVSTCFGLLTLAMIAGRGSKIKKARAHKIVLMGAVYDHEGRLMVLPDGTLPAKVITDTFPERSFEESFGPRHPVFQWCYRTSRYWRGVADLIPSMRTDLRDNIDPVPLGTTYQDEYSAMFKELFCTAAKDLADAMHIPFEKIGVLHEEIISTGGNSRFLLESNPEIGRKGKVLFLAKSATKIEAQRLAAAGFRFAPIQTLIPIVTQSMQATKDTVEAVLINMSRNTSPYPIGFTPPHVYLTCFALRANKETGFDILVPSKATHNLPSLRLQDTPLTAAQLSFLKTFENRPVSEILTKLARSQPKSFAELFHITLARFTEKIKDPFFLSATLGLSLVTPKHNPQQIIFRATVPIHTSARQAAFKFHPFSFFNAQQRCFEGDIAHATLARLTHREFSERHHTYRGALKRAETVSTTRYQRFRSLSMRDDASRSLKSTSEKNLVDGRVEEEVISGNGDPFGGTIMVERSVQVSHSLGTELETMGPSSTVIGVGADEEEATWVEQVVREFLVPVRN